MVVQASGKRVPVVQAYAYGKYMGKLKMTFDDNGEATAWSGAPILLDSSIQQGIYSNVLRVLLSLSLFLDSYRSIGVGGIE